MKEEFIDLFTSFVKRPGAERLLDWIKGTDFFSCPASTRYHLAEAGGLVKHSVHVYRRLRELYKNERIQSGCLTLTAEEEERIAICALLHDLCKANFYKTSTRNVKNEATGQWEKIPYYTVEDQFPYGHGEKSVFLIERFMKLRVEEAVAIRWHMGGFDESAKGGSYAVSNAFEKYPLAVMLHIADMQATYLDEVEGKEVPK